MGFQWKGLDVEMGSNPRNTYFAKPLLDSVNSGKVPISVVNDKVRRVLRVMFYAQKKGVIPKNGIVSTPEHGKAAYDIASESIVLLKNIRNLLPLNLKGVKKIAIIGDNATHKHALEGFGAGVKARYEITPLEGLKSKIGAKADIIFVQGYKPKYLRTAGGSARQTDDTSDSSLVKEAVSAALSSDITILFVGTNRVYETEGTDRLNLNLPWGQDVLISAVTKANPNTIIVIVSGAPVDLKNTVNSSSAIIWAGFNGSEGGNAIADVLLGNINPSGKLPLTFPVTLTDSPVQTLKAVPGQNTVEYSEGLLIGYRWFDTKKIEPQFCFGYGLSYTSFAYSGFKISKKSYSNGDKIEVSLKMKNTGSKAGKETVQIYITDEDQKVFKPVQELKAFTKVLVGAGKTVDVKMEIPVSDLAYFDVNLMKWVVSAGSYKVFAGSSSRDIRASGVVVIKE
jgi:beta-glucosidase